MGKGAKKTSHAEAAPAELAHVAFKTAFIPASREQRQRLEQGFGTARFAFNWALRTWEANRAAGLTNSFIGLRNTLNSLKKEQFPWMAEVIDMPKEKNFFETKVTEYKTGGSLEW